MPYSIERAKDGAVSFLFRGTVLKEEVSTAMDQAHRLLESAQTDIRLLIVFGEHAKFSWAVLPELVTRLRFLNFSPSQAHKHFMIDLQRDQRLAVAVTKVLLPSVFPRTHVFSSWKDYHRFVDSQPRSEQLPASV
jgi:hypothetical protein